MVERSVFGGFTGALSVQNKPPQLLLAQAYIILCVHICVLCTECEPLSLYTLRWMVVYLFYSYSEWLAVVMMHRLVIVDYFFKKSTLFRILLFSSLLFSTLCPSLSQRWGHSWLSLEVGWTRNIREAVFLISQSCSQENYICEGKGVYVLR